MSLPPPVLDLAASVVPDAEDRGRLAFAYAHGAVVSGFGDSGELGLVCVWDEADIPADAPADATHVTQTWFDELLKTITSGGGWREPGARPLADIAAFAYGVLLSDDEGAGTAARGTVSEFPTALAARSAQVLTEDLATVPAALADQPDPWLRFTALSAVVYRAHVAWFAGNGHYFPGPRRRAEYAARFGMADAVLKAELRLWETTDAAQLSERYGEFARMILDEQ